MGIIRGRPTFAGNPLSSALRDFTSEFEMVSGGALSVWPPYNTHNKEGSVICFTKYWRIKITIY